MTCCWNLDGRITWHGGAAGVMEESCCGIQSKLSFSRHTELCIVVFDLSNVSCAYAKKSNAGSKINDAVCN